MNDRSPDSIPPGAGRFATTHWSAVIDAQTGDTSNADRAMEQLCRAYWYPLYAFIRRQGHGPHDAQDLVQSFFARFLEKHYLNQVDRSKGRFRSFLLASLKHFLANERDKLRSLKRGGGFQIVPLDPGSAETRFGSEPADNRTADKIFERRWALTLLDQALARVRAAYRADGKEILFDALKPALAGKKAAGSYADLGRQLGMSEGAVKVAVHRMRLRYREILRAEVAATVATAEDIDDEIRHLFSAL